MRDRLQGPREHFRAALAGVARELAESGVPLYRVDREAAALRREKIDPRIAEMRSELEALGARRTLLRVASDRAVPTALLATVTLVVGHMTGLAEVLQAALEALAAPTSLAAIAKEAGTRADVRAQLQARPYWLLHETDELLSARRPS